MKSLLPLLLLVLTALPLDLPAQENWTQPFPRLAMWWPDVYRPELYERIASYDWIAVSGDEVQEVLEKIKPLNPSLKVADSVNFTESQAFSGERNDPRNVRRLPAEFFLTQIGSTLRTSIDSRTTIIPLNSTRLPDGKPRFARGDYVLCERETMRVRSVDHARGLIVVRRGVYRRAAAHRSGRRIASAISFWPGTFVMNIAGKCPRVTLSRRAGPENWVQYVSRTAGKARDGVDALQIDRTDGDQSWLVDGGYARTIDPDCSNRQVRNYSAFDRHWNSGMRNLLARIRAANPGLPVFLNNGISAYDLTNGSILESVIYWDTEEPLFVRWLRAVLGWADNEGSYLDWASRSLTPNYTLWEIYEDNRSVDETDPDNYDNPAEQPGFVPNYQRMRFGLATALLGDGFYSYEISTFVHGGRWLMWFDEYDNAGAGRGYLGLPLGDPVVVVSDEADRPVVLRRDFEHGIALVNPSADARTVSLGAEFRKISGTQAPLVNDGTLVSEVSLAAHDGLILLKP